MSDYRQWIRIVETKQFIGYRIVSYSPEKGYQTLAGQEPVYPKIGKTYWFADNGLYLGISKQFCLDYYTGLSDDTDVMLTYEFKPNDVIEGNPSATDGEFTVSRAKLIAIDHLS